MNKKKMPLSRLLGLTFVIAGVLFCIVAFINHENPAIYSSSGVKCKPAVGAAALLLRKK